MKLSIVILNYNVEHFLELCLSSVLKATTLISSEVIVVDNNSSDGSCAMVKQKFPQVKLIENKENSGFSKGNNIGVNNAKGEFVCILNPDTVVTEDTFTKLIDHAESLPDLGIIGCKLIDGKGQFLPESKRNIPVVKVALQKMLGNSKHYYANHLKPTETGEVDILVGAFMFLKTEVYKAVGGFDEDYFMYGEDIDLSYKILKAGYKNYYFSDCTIIHFKGESTLKDKSYAKRFFGAMQLFYKKHFKSNVLFDTIVSIGIKLAYVFRKEALEIKSSPNHYLLVSENLDSKLETILKIPIILTNDITEVEANSEIIFDASFITYKSMIQIMSQPKINSKSTFKIIPDNSKFLIGSNDSKNRGEVIHF
ncbi:glycosyltransferase family 2 protein [Ichthyenterobacterium sp. W332]|uniref:Glycosyltransferase family 2 protein n=1 Tax=Microcosmobacter mediterraneus TaxID=3075607 RepID=A0ABU2YH62_9FLAO|nr:glycosyltransferase family 2 protein [Ichthyenterobacterium sp. W332]MDT0557039.1 glycosyltransferase family 2 protein [Ichthyenterobacterium sp. W332]